MPAKTNTTKSVSDSQLQLETDKVKNEFLKEKKVKVSIPKTLENQLGKTLPVGINGSMIVIPVDGEDYEIPETFAKHVKEYLKTLS